MYDCILNTQQLFDRFRRKFQIVLNVTSKQFREELGNNSIPRSNNIQNAI